MCVTQFFLIHHIVHRKWHFSTLKKKKWVRLKEKVSHLNFLNSSSRSPNSNRFFTCSSTSFKSSSRFSSNAVTCLLNSPNCSSRSLGAQNAIATNAAIKSARNIFGAPTEKPVRFHFVFISRVGRRCRLLFPPHFLVVGQLLQLTC